MRKMLLIFAVCVSLLSIQINAQEDAKVKRVMALTAENIIFQAWINSQNVKLGNNVSINYRIVNKSEKPLYLVKKNIDDRLVIEDDKIIFPRPFVLVSTHEAYDYSFTRVKKGGTLVGQLNVTPAEYKESQPWLVLVGFGYITDIKGLTPNPREINDPIPYKALLSSRLRTLQLGGLYVEVTDD